MVIHLRKLLLLVCAAAVMAACGGPSTAYRREINQKIARGDLGGALQQVESSKSRQYSKKNAVLYYLDRGALLYDLNRYQDSDLSFAEADRIMEELFTRSVTRGIGTVVLNDNTTEYGGESFERAIMHTYRAMNYVMQDNIDEALVEARRVSSYLARYSQFMQGKSGYIDSPFAQYLTAMLYEESGNTDDARISYDAFKKAISGNFSYIRIGDSPTSANVRPSRGTGDSVRGGQNSMRKARRRRSAALNASFDDLMENDSSADSANNTNSAAINNSFDDLMNEKPAAKARPARKNISKSIDNLFGVPAYSDLNANGVGEIVLLHYNGPAPMKISKTFQVAWNDARTYVSQSGERNSDYEKAINAGFTRHAITVAYPEYTQQPYNIMSSRISVEGNSADSLLMEDISKDAYTTLDAKKNAIWARAVARATIKFVVAEAAAEAARKAAEEAFKKDGKSSPFGSLIGGLASGLVRGGVAATEIADTRGWTTIPAQIRMARMTAEPGTHNVTVQFLNGSGMVIGQQVFENIEVKAGKRTYLHVRTAM